MASLRLLRDQLPKGCRTLKSFSKLLDKELLFLIDNSDGAKHEDLYDAVESIVRKLINIEFLPVLISEYCKSIAIGRLQKLRSLGITQSNGEVEKLEGNLSNDDKDLIVARSAVDIFGRLEEMKIRLERFELVEDAGKIKQLQEFAKELFNV